MSGKWAECRNDPDKKMFEASHIVSSSSCETRTVAPNDKQQKIIDLFGIFILSKPTF